jgi:S1-C subfamily serine protease
MVSGLRPPWHPIAGVACAAILAIALPVAAAGAPDIPGGPAGLHTSPPPASFATVARTAAAATILLRSVHGSPLPELDADDDEPCENDDQACAEREDFRRFLARFIAALRQRTLGSGVIVHGAGFALTSARAVLGAGDFEVVLGDGTAVDAIVLGLDRRTDVAVLKLANATRIYPYLPLGDSDAVRAGDWVIAVGAPHGLSSSVTAGIVTAAPAPEGVSPVAAFLQTDAVLGRGTAGGPVVNLGGEVVGIATPLAGDGVGYAMPSRVVQRIFLELLERGRVSRPWIGVSTQTLRAAIARALGARQDAGVLITDVMPDGPAARAGLRPGDIVLEVEAVPVDSRATLERAVGKLTIGRGVRVKVRRDGRDQTVTMKVAEEPDEWALPPAQARARSLTGLEVRPITPDMGVVVTWAEPGSPADAAGLERGDVIRAINRQPIRKLGDFEAAARGLRAGDVVLLHVQRGEIALYVTLQTEALEGAIDGPTRRSN